MASMTAIDDVSRDERSSFRDYTQILWGRRWVVIGVTVAVLGVSLAYSFLTTPVYQGTTELLLAGQLPSTVLQANNSFDPQVTVDVPTQIQVLESASVAAIVDKVIPDAPPVQATEVGLTDVVTVSVQSTDPDLAAGAATEYADAYLEQQRRQTASALTSAAELLQTRLTSVQATIDSIHNEVLQGNASSSTGVQAELAAQQTALQTQAQSLQSQLTTYQLYASSQSGESGQVISQATVSNRPVKPKTVEYALLAAILGLTLGVGAAMALEVFDDGIRVKEDVERVARSQPVLGLVPEMANWRNPDAAYLVSRSSPKSAPAEAHRSLRTSIQFLGLERSIRTLQFTSPIGPEGKTVTLANLAVVTAQAGLRVVMVDCDLRRPRLHEFFGLSNAVGFTSVLLQERTLDEALAPVPGLEHLRLLASGPIPPNPSELLSGTRSSEVFERLAADADLVLVDSPPVLLLSDAAALAGRVDAVVMVASAKTSSRTQVTRSLERLGQVEAPVLGVVLNRASEVEPAAKDRFPLGVRRVRDRPRPGRSTAGPRRSVTTTSAASGTRPPSRGGPSTGTAVADPIERGDDQYLS